MLIYIAIAIIALAVIAVVFIYNRKNRKQKPSRLAMLGMLLVVAGIVFGDDRLVGYGLIGAGVLLAVIDVIMNLRKK